MLTFHAVGDWRPEQVRASWVQSTRVERSEVERLVESAWSEVRQRPGVRLFDGPMCRMESWQARPDALELVLSPTSYRIFLGTNLSHPELADQYGKNVLANPVGVSPSLLTADGFLMMGCRNASVAYYPNRVHPFAGALEPKDLLLEESGDQGRGVFSAVRRELAEELSLDDGEIFDVCCTGVAEDRQLRQPELIFRASVCLPRSELERRLDRREHQDSWSIPNSPEAISKTILNSSEPADGTARLTPVALASLLLFGRMTYGNAWFVDHAQRLGAIIADGAAELMSTSWSASVWSDRRIIYGNPRFMSISTETAASPPAADLQYVMDLARRAGALVLEYFGKTARLTKTHAATTNEAVTEADRASQRLIVASLRQRFPKDGVIGEENDAGDAITFDAPTAGSRFWVIDPIDGTNNFVAGLPFFAVCIGLLDAGSPVLGVVYDVCGDRMYSAAAGHGAWLNGRRIESLRTPLNDSTLLMLTSNCIDGDGCTPGYALRWLGQTHWKIRMLGSAALEAVQVAAGIAHGAVTVNGKLWDVAAPAAIVLEAGGKITNHRGQPIFPFDLRGYRGAKVPFLAGAPAAHEELLQELAR